MEGIFYLPSSQTATFTHSGPRTFHWTTAICVSISGIGLGADLGVFRSERFIVNDWDLWLRTLYGVGSLIGAMGVGWFAPDLISRRWSISLSAVIMAISTAFIIADVSPGVLLFGRCLQGVGAGLLSVSVPVYLAETAPAASRGSQMLVFQIFINAGALGAGALIYLWSGVEIGGAVQSWRLVLGIQLIPIAFVGCAMIALGSTPHYHLLKGRETDASKKLARLRGLQQKSNEFQLEYFQLKAGFSSRLAVRSPTLFSAPVRRRVLLICVMQILVATTASSIYSHDVSSALSGMTPSSMVVGSGLIAFVASFIATILIDMIGRKALFIAGGVTLTISQVFLCAFLTLYKSAPSTDSDFKNGVLVGGILLVLGILSCWVPVSIVYQAEVFPLRLRAKGVALGTGVSVFWSTLISLILPIIERSSIGFYVYAILAAFSLISTVLAFFFVLETKGLPLANMDEVFNSSDLDLDLSLEEKSANF